MIRIELLPATANDATYGITHRSAHVYRTAHSHSPTRIVVWSNTGRPNARNGEPIQYGAYGPTGGGNGRFLDPHNKATDAERSILLSTEASIITNNGTNTGTVASGQVYATDVDKLRDGMTLTLVFPDGSEETVTARFPRHGNGHGFTEA